MTSKIKELVREKDRERDRNKVWEREKKRYLMHDLYVSIWMTKISARKPKKY